jgi:hypothetical protein
MKNEKNLHYGVSVDGFFLKIAEITNSHDQLHLLRILTYRLSEHIYVETGNITNIYDFSQEHTKNVEKRLAIKEYEDIDSIDFDDLHEVSSESGDLLDNINSNKKILEGLYEFFKTLDISRGSISISCHDTNIIWKYFSARKGASIKELKKYVLSEQEILDPTIDVEFLDDANAGKVAVIHKGKYDLMAILDDISEAIFGKKLLKYKHIEPIEIGLLNMFNLFYPHENNDYITLFYYSEEIRLGVIVKEKKLVKTFNIYIAETEPEKLHDAVVKKLLLEHNKSDVPILNNVILTGHYANEEVKNIFTNAIGSVFRVFDVDTSQLTKKYGLYITDDVDKKQIN